VGKEAAKTSEKGKTVGRKTGDLKAKASKRRKSPKKITPNKSRPGEQRKGREKRNAITSGWTEKEKKREGRQSLHDNQHHVERKRGGSKRSIDTPTKRRGKKGEGKGRLPRARSALRMHNCAVRRPAKSRWDERGCRRNQWTIYEEARGGQNTSNHSHARSMKESGVRRAERVTQLTSYERGRKN